MAYALFNLAAGSASSDGSTASKERDRIASSMTSQQIEAGQSLTRDLSDKPIKAIDNYLALKKR
ncbi:hypothetical protein D3C87_2161900 [compost metagenome]